MISDAHGNLIRADAEALVNTVNCVGYMGKGIALQFKRGFPDNFKAYERACKVGEVRPGRMFIHETGRLVNPKYIINFPTKRHWRGKSRIEDIEAGLDALVADIQRLGIRSVAIPPLGCGNGGLDWNVVKPGITNALEAIPDVQVFLYGPDGAPDPRSMAVRTPPPRLTIARALILQLMSSYESVGYGLTLLEVQKLAYFLQEADEPLRLRYEAGIYGPYADNLNKVLELLEGHFIRGYGDSPRPDTQIEVMNQSREKSARFLERHAASLGRLERVSQLIEGFETPYGLELLSSVHWVAKRNPHSSDQESVIGAVHDWNDRKRRLMKAGHIRVAWQRLATEGWLPGCSS
jgi:O-acetyl-ADP-ribose deacetylase (regulator of RNase III)